jgi:hypothetical protein
MALGFIALTLRGLPAAETAFLQNSPIAHKVIPLACLLAPACYIEGAGNQNFPAITGGYIGAKPPEVKNKGEGEALMNLFEEIRLPNGLAAEVWDGSRMIAADTTTVVLVVKIPVDLKQEYFEDAAACRKTAEIFGSPLVYEYRNERTFVPAGEREALFNEFLANFKKDILPYVSKAHFPKRFVLSKYNEMIKDPWKYPDRG